MAARQTASKKKTPKRQVGNPIPAKDLEKLQKSITAEMANDAATSSGRKKLFDDALLPEEKTTTWRAGRTPWVMPTLFVLVLVALWAWFVVQQSSGQEEAGVKTALKNIETALAQQDVASFDKHVNIPSVAESIATQMFAAPTSNLTPSAAVEFSALQERFDTLVKPALSLNIEEDIAAFASTGNLDSASILGQLRNDVLPEGASFRIADITVANTTGLARMTITRPDLALPEGDSVTLPLTAKLFRTEAGNWQVMEIIALNKTLDALSSAEGALKAYRDAQSAGALTQALSVERITKAAIDESTLLAALEVTNASGKDMASFSGVVTFADAAGRTLKDIAVTHKDMLAAGEKLGKTWTLSVDTNKAGERHVLALPMSAMSATFMPMSITFSDGTTLGQ